MTYFNGSSCSLLNFFDHTVQGEEKETLPKWGGTTGIQEALTASTETVTQIQTGTSTLYGPNYNDLKTSNGTIESSIKSFVDYYSVTPPFTTDKPDYIDQLKDLQDPNTLIGKVYVDYLSNVYTPLNLFEELKTPLSSIQNSQGLTGNLDSASQSVQALGDVIDSASDLIATNFVDLQDSISNYIVLIFNIIFGFFIVMSGGIIALVVFRFYEIWIFKNSNSHILEFFFYIFIWKSNNWRHFRYFKFNRRTNSSSN